MWEVLPATALNKQSPKRCRTNVQCILLIKVKKPKYGILTSMNVIIR